jgi:curved DNA-binding protein CbpA
LSSYRAISVNYHPDKLKNLSEEERVYKTKEFDGISNAYKTLVDPDKRKVYDITGSDGNSGTGSGGRVVIEKPKAGGEDATMWLAIVAVLASAGYFLFQKDKKGGNAKSPRKKGNAQLEWFMGLNLPQQIYIVVCILAGLAMVFSGTSNDDGPVTLSKEEEGFYNMVDNGIKFLESDKNNYKAMKAFEMAIDVDPTHPISYLLSGQASHEAEEHSEGLKLIEKGISVLISGSGASVADKAGTEAYMALAYNNLYQSGADIEDSKTFRPQAITIVEAAAKKWGRKCKKLVQRLNSLKKSMGVDMADAEGEGSPSPLLFPTLLLYFSCSPFWHFLLLFSPSSCRCWRQ